MRSTRYMIRKKWGGHKRVSLLRTWEWLQIEEGLVKLSDRVDAIYSGSQLRISILHVLLNLSCNIGDISHQKVRCGHDDRRPLTTLQRYHPVPTEVGSLSAGWHVPLITAGNLFGTVPGNIFCIVHKAVLLLQPFTWLQGSSNSCLGLRSWRLHWAVWSAWWWSPWPSHPRHTPARWSDTAGHWTARAWRPGVRSGY